MLSSLKQALATPIGRYVAMVSAAGLVVMALSARDLGSVSIGQQDRWTIGLFFVLVMAGEVWTIRVPHGDEEEEELSTSTTFAFALLVTVGPGLAMLALGLASLLADFMRAKPGYKGLFNVCQYNLSLGAAGIVLNLFHGYRILDGGAANSGAGLILPIMASGAAFFIVNHVIVVYALALSQGIPLSDCIWDDIPFQASTTGVMLALTPIVVALAHTDPVLIPFLAVPIALVRRYAATLLAKDHLASHDALTGLPNRNLFATSTDEAIVGAIRGGGQVAVLLLDLDHFKDVNDTLGHETGDALLKLVGPRIRSSLPSGGLVARLGGDEYAVLLAAGQGEEVATEVARTVLAALDKPFVLGSMPMRLDASIGIAVAPRDGGDAATLFQRADVAMYQAKRRRTGAERYAPEQDPYSPERLVMFNEIRGGLDAGEFVVYFQPKASIATGLITGVEALARWHHPHRGVVGPNVFLPLVHHAGLSRVLTHRVLEASLRQVRRWHDEGLSLTVSVNVDEDDVADGKFPSDVALLLDRIGVAPEWLHLEITEDTVMTDPERMTAVLGRLEGMGIELSLDDFGTGRSSFAYLKHLPVSEIKIDKSFVMGMHRDPGDMVIVRSAIDLARNLGFRSVAEGVEDEAAWNRLAELGCDVAQGYWLGRPVPAEELASLLRQRAVRATASAVPAAPHPD